MDGNLPDPASVRAEEFVNAFDQDYAAPTEGTFAISSDGGPSPFLDEGEVLLRIGVQAKEITRLERPDAALTFVIDTSGSMAREDRLGLVKQALTFLVDRLRPRDTRRDRRRSAPTPRSSSSRPPPRTPTRILSAIDSLQPSGSTNAEAGLRLGYQLAVRRPARGRDQPRDPGLGRRRQPRQHRPRVDPRPRPPGRRAGDPARHRRLRDGQLQRRPDGAARRQGRRLLRLRQPARRRPDPVRRAAHLHAGHRGARRQGAGRVQPRRRRGLPPRRLREPRGRPTRSSATTRSTPARSARATPRPPSTPCG